MNNYHQLPCGTAIPPEGVKAWVKDSCHDSWCDETIIGYANDKVITERSCFTWDEYRLTDPTLLKKRAITSHELYGKCLHMNEIGKVFMMVIGSDDTHVFTRIQARTIEDVMNECMGYSDTPTSELKPFWLDEAEDKITLERVLKNLSDNAASMFGEDNNNKPEETRDTPQADEIMKSRAKEMNNTQQGEKNGTTR